MAAMSLNVLPELLETTIGTPAAAAARAIATSPSGSAARCSVIGAMPRGRSYVVPSRSVEVSTWRDVAQDARRHPDGLPGRDGLTDADLVAGALADVAEHRLGQGLAGEGLHLVEPSTGHRLSRSSTPARFFLPRRRTSQSPAIRSPSPGTWSTSVIRSLLR